MQQIPIEEILVEFRKKYSDTNSAETGGEKPNASQSIPYIHEYENSVGNEINTPQIDSDISVKLQSRRGSRTKGREFTFPQIIIVQGIVAISTAIILGILRICDEGLYNYIMTMLRG